MAFVSSSTSSFKSYEPKHSKHERSPFSSVSMTALNYQATDRIRSLAKPRIRTDLVIQNNNNQRTNKRSLGYSQSMRTPTIVPAQPSLRLCDLAFPVKRYRSYEFEIPLPKSQSPIGIQYSSTEKINELGLTKKHSIDH